MSQFMERYKRLGQVFDPETIELQPSLRVNTLRISKKDLLPRLESKGVLLKRVPFLNAGYYFESSFALASSEEYLLGYIYLQEAASQLPAQVLLSTFDPVKDSDALILDLCAAPGSKTTQLAQITNDKVTILALDDSAPRLNILRHNLERLKITSVSCFKKDGRFADDLEIKSDFILVDAPCSGNFCVERNFFTERSLLLGVKGRVKLQKELLRSAYKSLKTGGFMVYSTCSLEPEEDELVMDWFIEKYPSMKLISTGLDIGDSGLTSVFDKDLDPSLNLTRRFWPHKTGTEGFFIAKLQKFPEDD